LWQRTDAHRVDWDNDEKNSQPGVCNPICTHILFLGKSKIEECVPRSCMPPFPAKVNSGIILEPKIKLSKFILCLCIVEKTLCKSIKKYDHRKLKLQHGKQKFHQLSIEGSGIIIGVSDRNQSYFQDRLS
jgi:hypothetical protein